MWQWVSVLLLTGVAAAAQAQSAALKTVASCQLPVASKTVPSLQLSVFRKASGFEVPIYRTVSGPMRHCPEPNLCLPWAGQSSGTPPIIKPEGFHWGGALKQSGFLLGIQHSLRMAQEKTRMHLGGNWWDDYKTSLDRLSGWNDGNPIITNYVGHPIMGAVTGFIQIQNDPGGASLEWSPHDRAYWKSRSKALGWAALYSTQYELGPAGEAMIGNVGYDRGTMAYVDLVVTPVGGFGMLLLEDWLDKRVIEKVEQGKSERKMRFFRVVMNPSRSLANMLRFKRPSYRENR